EPALGGATAPPRRGSVVGRGQPLFDRLQVCLHLGILLPQRLDAPDRAHHRGVIAVAEGSAELGEAALEALAAQVHRDLTREGDALVAILAQELAVRETE